MTPRSVPLWLKLFLFASVILLPSSFVLVLSFQTSLGFLADIAINADVESALASNLDALRRLNELDPKSDEQALVPIFAKHQQTYQAYTQLREVKAELVDTFERHALIVCMVALLLSLGLAAALARNIIRLFRRYAEASLVKQHQEASLRVLENWQMVSQSVIHELKSSLTPLCLFSDALRSCHSPLEQEAATLVATEVAKMQTLIDELTGFARLPRPRCQDDDLVDTILYLQKNYLVDGLELHLDTTLLPANACRVQHDAAMLQRLLFNLMRNAREANTQAQALDFCLHLSLEATWLRLDITDNGCGIPTSLLSSIFEPRVSHHSRPQEEPGPLRLPSNLGLGLTIAKKIALDHGGDLFALPSTSGAHFVLLLPRYQTNPVHERPPYA